MKRLVLALALFAAACGSSPTAPSTTLPATLWTVSGTGDNVFNMPSYVTRVRVTGSYAGSSSNFIVWIGQGSIDGQLLVNELLGTSWNAPTYSGTLLVTTTLRVVSITNSSGVAWSFTEVR